MKDYVPLIYKKRFNIFQTNEKVEDCKIVKINYLPKILTFHSHFLFLFFEV